MRRPDRYELEFTMLMFIVLAPLGYWAVRALFRKRRTRYRDPVLPHVRQISVSVVRLSLQVSDDEQFSVFGSEGIAALIGQNVGLLPKLVAMLGFAYRPEVLHCGHGVTLQHPFAIGPDNRRGGNAMVDAHFCNTLGKPVAPPCSRS
jgi:hypothetical protein